MEQEKSRYTTLQNLKYMFDNWMKWDKKSIWLCILRVPAQVLLPMLTVSIPALMIQFIEEKRSIGQMAAAVSIMSVLIAGLTWIDPFLSNYMKSHAEKIQSIYRIDAFRKMMTLSYQEIESKESRERNELGQKFSSYWWGGARATFDVLVMLAVNLLGIVSYLAVLSQIHPLLLLLILLTTIGDVLLLKLLKKYRDKFNETYSKIGARYYYLYEKAHDFAAGKDIRIYGLGDFFLQMIALANRTHIALISKFTRQNIRVTGGRALLSMLRDAVAYIYLIYCVLYQGMSVQEFIFYFGMITGFAAWILGVSNWSHELEAICQECDHYRVFMETEQEEQKTHARPVPVLPGESCSITFEHVHFTYKGAEEETLKDLSFTVRPGENIAIVGENGAGKTTAVKLLCGFYQPTKGRILINGQNITDCDREDYYRLFSAVFQDYNFLPMTVEENITLEEKERVDQKKLMDVITKAGIRRRLEELPKGLDTLMVKEVHKDATSFSGGEAQKLLLARALYKEAPVLILDEPTAALDPIAENELYERYNALTKGKTSFFISHRLSSTRFCDRIFFISNGQITESGTHDELMAQKGGYWKMFQVQSHYYREGADA